MRKPSSSQGVLRRTPWNPRSLRANESRSARRGGLLAALLFFGCALRPLPAPASPAVIPLTLPSGGVFQTELMINDQDRAMGLMFRPSLPADRALLFVFEDISFHGIWMKNCRFPIDIVWLDENKKVVHIAPRVPPCATEPCPVYAPLRRSAYVVEMNAGAARREKIVLGAALGFTLPR